MKSFFQWKAVFISLVFTFVCVSLMLGVSVLSPDWGSWQQATSMPDHAFNEAIHEGYLRQPWNTFSSFAYSFVGVYVLCLSYDSKGADSSIRVSNNLIVRLIFGMSLIIAGLGSAFLHMSLTFVGQTTDVVGMYLLSVFIILYAIMRTKKISLKIFILIFLCVNLILFVPLVLSPELRRNLFAGLIIAGLIIEYLCNHDNNGNNYNLLLTSASVMLFGFIFWMLDNTKLYFDPLSWFQGHVIWHLCGAIAAGILYFYYLREDRDRASSDLET